jgi:hypothetical protein
LKALAAPAKGEARKLYALAEVEGLPLCDTVYSSVGSGRCKASASIVDAISQLTTSALVVRGAHAC